MDKHTETATYLETVTTVCARQEKPHIWALSMDDLGHAQWDRGDGTDVWGQALPVLD